MVLAEFVFKMFQDQYLLYKYQGIGCVKTFECIWYEQLLMSRCKATFPGYIHPFIGLQLKHMSVCQSRCHILCTG